VLAAFAERLVVSHVCTWTNALGGYGSTECASHRLLERRDAIDEYTDRWLLDLRSRW
jgi:hypothetical protein